MQQSTVTDYFKVKKRTRDESSSSTNKAKVIAAISSSGKDGPSPIRTTESSSPDGGQNEIDIKPIVPKLEETECPRTPENRKMTTARRVVTPKAKVTVTALMTSASTSATDTNATCARPTAKVLPQNTPTSVSGVPSAKVTVQVKSGSEPATIGTKNTSGTTSTVTAVKKAPAPPVKKVPSKMQLQAMKSLASKLMAAPTKRAPPSTPTKPTPRSLNDVTPTKETVPVSASPLQTISPSKFFSPSRQRDIFSSPVKLSEIRSPSPNKLAISLAGRATVKRLFDSTNSTDAGNESPSPSKIPAYQRFHHLAQKTAEEHDASTPMSPAKPLQETGGNSTSTPTAPRPTEEPLHLPFKFKVLQELFQAVETVTSILYNRKELITFEKVRPAVQQLVRRINLKEKHLGQMLTVFPGCYNLCFEKLKVGGSYQEATSSNQLIIGINLSATPGMVGESDIMSPVIITERRRIFRHNLLKIAHGHHRTFLSSLIPPIVIPSDKLVTRWHPKFRLDEVPDIGAGAVPEKAAAVANERINTARDVLAKAQNIIENANPKMKKALQDLLKKTTEDKDKDKKSHNPSASATVSAGSNSNPSTAPTSTVQHGNGNNKNTKKSLAALKGISQSLIEKIRAREHEKSIRAMTLSPEEIRQKTMLNRLPDFVKMLRNTMVAEKKTALTLSFIVERLGHSTHGTLSPGDVEDHIRLLASKLPIFVTIIRSTQGEYVKVNKDLDINDLLDSLKEIIRKFN